MATYIKAYQGTTPLFQSDASTWTRPTDWLTLPAAASGTVKGLHAVFNNTTNFATVRASTLSGANYTIDWGDGVVESAASNAIINHNYDWNNVSAATITSGGYRQAIVTITPPSGSSFTQIFFSEKYTATSGLQSYSTGWLDMNINLPNLLTGQRLFIGGAPVRHAFLERVNIASWGNITSAASMFYNCTALREINSAQWITTAITNFDSMFFNCQSLQIMDGSTWSTAAVTSMSNMFRGNKALLEIRCAGWNTGACTSFAFFAFDCPSLVKCDVSAWNMVNVTTLNNAFNGCNAISELAIGNWTLTNLTIATNMVRECFNLRKTNITTLSLPAATSANAMFETCYALPSIGTVNIPSGATATSLCNGCNSLKSAGFTGINASTSFANCMLSGTELNAIYTALSATGTGKTITVTGNFGTATHNPTIATAKGWTVTV